MKWYLIVVADGLACAFVVLLGLLRARQVDRIEAARKRRENHPVFPQHLNKTDPIVAMAERHVRNLFKGKK